jgi:predicted DsbA family dithiol-disulfide isomerase
VEQAIAAAPPSLDIKVRWRPFQLNPQASQEGVNKLKFYNDKFGAARVNAMVPMMTQVRQSGCVVYDVLLLSSTEIP